MNVSYFTVMTATELLHSQAVAVVRARVSVGADRQGINAQAEGRCVCSRGGIIVWEARHGEMGQGSPRDPTYVAGGQQLGGPAFPAHPTCLANTGRRAPLHQGWDFDRQVWGRARSGESLKEGAMITDCGIHLGEEGSKDRGMGMTDRGKVGGVRVLEKTRGVGAGQEIKLKTGNEVTWTGSGERQAW